MNIISLVSGTYYLQIVIDDTVNQRSYTKDVKFFVYREGDADRLDSLKAQSTQLNIQQNLENIYQNMTEEEIDNEFKAASYIASRADKKIYKTLDFSGKKTFMPQFWSRQDKSPETPRNEFREKFLYLGRAYFMIGDADKALYYLEFAYQNVSTLTTYGVIYANNGEMAKAKEYFNKALRLAPGDPEILNNLKILEDMEEEK